MCQESETSLELLNYITKNIEKVKEYKRAIVLSGDGDFAPLLEHLMSEGKEIIVISAPRITAREIKSLVGGNFIDFGTLKYLLEYKKP